MKFKVLKNIWEKVKHVVKDVGDKVVKPVVRKVLKHAPGLTKVLVKAIKLADKVGARRVILNLIPEAGPYVNMAIDYLIKAQEKGVVDDACEMLQKVVEGKMDMKTFIEDVKKLIGDASQIEVDGMPNPLKIVDQVVNTKVGGTENKPALKIGRNPSVIRGLDVLQKQREKEKKIKEYIQEKKIKEYPQESTNERKLMRGDRETLMKEALAREAEENEGRTDNDVLADDIFGPSVNK